MMPVQLASDTSDTISDTSDAYNAHAHVHQQRNAAAEPGAE